MTSANVVSSIRTPLQWMRYSCGILATWHHAHCQNKTRARKPRDVCAGLSVGEWNAFMPGLGGPGLFWSCWSSHAWDRTSQPEFSTVNSGVMNWWIALPQKLASVLAGLQQSAEACRPRKANVSWTCIAFQLGCPVIKLCTNEGGGWLGAGDPRWPVSLWTAPLPHT